MASPWAFVFPSIKYSKLTEHFMSHGKFQELIGNEGNAFDVVMVEVMWMAIAGVVSQRYKAPLIIFSPVQNFPGTDMLVGNLAHSSFMPCRQSKFSSKMTFWERVENFLMANMFDVKITHFFLSDQDRLMKQYVNSELPHLGDILSNTSLVFVNDYLGLSSTTPMVPNIIPIGGIHVRPPKPLPADLQTIMNDSKNGVIYFSLGSYILSSHLDDGKIDVIIETFAKLKETVIWKYENEHAMLDLPKNVIISTWLPQSDLLAHPNLKLFITHGGQQSITESQARGVPIVGIPLMTDGPANIKQSTLAGVGISLEYDTLTSETFFSVIRKVIDSPKYKEAAMIQSKRFNDRPMSPMDTAVYWVEYVIRHKGAPHLRSASLDLAWYQLYQVDVIAMLVVLALLTLLASMLVVRKVLIVLFGRMFIKVTQTAATWKKNS